MAKKPAKPVRKSPAKPKSRKPAAKKRSGAKARPASKRARPSGRIRPASRLREEIAACAPPRRRQRKPAAKKKVVARKVVAKPQHKSTASVKSGAKTAAKALPKVVAKAPGQAAQSDCGQGRCTCRASADQGCGWQGPCRPASQADDRRVKSPRRSPASARPTPPARRAGMAGTPKSRRACSRPPTSKRASAA